MVPCIGYEVSLSGWAHGHITVRLAENKRQKLREPFEQLLSYQGMLPRRLLCVGMGFKHPSGCKTMVVNALCCCLTASTQ